MLDENKLKGGGFIKLRQPDAWAMRVKILVGDATVEQLQMIARIAEKFGDGTVHFTVRQCIEILYVRLEDFDEIHEMLESVGLGPGACGARVRVPVACPGSAVCKRGLNDTKALAKAIDARLYGREGLPHKWKVGVTGCSSSCAKPQENDLGFMGAVRPEFDEAGGACISCGICAQTCPVGAISYDEAGHPVFDRTKCEYDGKCVSACPTKAISASETGWRVFVGGKFGREPMLGVELLRFVSSERAVELAEAVLAAYMEAGRKGERMRNTIDRIGLDAFRESVLSHEGKEARDV